MNKEQLLRKIQAIGLMAVDLQLFLDTHPKNQEALDDYKQVTKQYQKLRAEYEYQYGPLTNFGYMTSFDHVHRRRPWSRTLVCDWASVKPVPTQSVGSDPDRRTELG